jgi:hypothetical protein
MLRRVPNTGPPRMQILGESFSFLVPTGAEVLVNG